MLSRRLLGRQPQPEILARSLRDVSRTPISARGCGISVAPVNFVIVRGTCVTACGITQWLFRVRQRNAGAHRAPRSAAVVTAARSGRGHARWLRATHRRRQPHPKTLENSYSRSANVRTTPQLDPCCCPWKHLPNSNGRIISTCRMVKVHADQFIDKDFLSWHGQKADSGANPRSTAVPEISDYEPPLPPDLSDCTKS